MTIHEYSETIDGKPVRFTTGNAGRIIWSDDWATLHATKDPRLIREAGGAETYGHTNLMWAPDGAGSGKPFYGGKKVEARSGSDKKK